MSTQETISENHPDEMQLVTYLESPQLNESQGIRRHLIGCSRCRKKVDEFQNIIHSLQHQRVVLQEIPPGEHFDEVDISDYVENRLAHEEHAKINEHIMGCAYCMSAALHYSIESAEAQNEHITESALTSERPSLHKAENEAGRFGKLAGILSWRMPVWIGVPTTGLAAIALFFLIFSGKESRLTVVSYQDKAEVVFSSPKGDVPGIGFFGGAREKAEPFGGITIHPEDAQHLRVKWSEIKTARLYEIRIYSSNGDGRVLIGEAGTSGATEVLLQVSGVVPGKRYEWELSGTTANDLRFLARGGFVVGVDVRF